MTLAGALARYGLLETLLLALALGERARLPLGPLADLAPLATLLAGAGLPALLFLAPIADGRWSRAAAALAVAASGGVAGAALAAAVAWRAAPLEVFVGSLAGAALVLLALARLRRLDALAAWTLPARVGFVAAGVASVAGAGEILAGAAIAAGVALVIALVAEDDALVLRPGRAHAVAAVLANPFVPGVALLALAFALDALVLAGATDWPRAGALVLLGAVSASALGPAALLRRADSS